MFAPSSGFLSNYSDILAPHKYNINSKIQWTLEEEEEKRSETTITTKVPKRRSYLNLNE